MRPLAVAGNGPSWASLQVCVGLKGEGSMHATMSSTGSDHCITLIEQESKPYPDGV